ncbi:MAG: C25 family cysteine peptidase [Chitinispirillaceae bacterium]|jgi:hypothetical protein
MKKSQYLIVGLLLMACPLAASVRVIQNTTSRLVFRWELGSFDTATLTFSGANVILGSVGKPAIPGFSVYAGIPVSGQVRVHFVPGTFRTITLRHPLKNNMIDGGKIYPMPKDIQFPDGWISVPRYTWLKNMRAVNLIIRPFRYDANTHTAQVLASGECTVDFPAGTPLSRSMQPMVTAAYQRVLKQQVLNYDVATGWMKPLQRKGLGKTADAFPLSSLQPRCTFTIGDGHAGMNSYQINENGILKIGGAQLKRIFGSLHGNVNVDTSFMAINSVALYASFKGELPEICPSIDSIPAGIAEVPLFRCDHNGNGFVDDSDYVLAYVTGLSDWGYNFWSSTFSYNLDNYDDNRHYWLTIKAGNGASVNRFVQPAGSAGIDDYFTNHIMFGQPVSQPVIIDINGTPVPDDIVSYVWEALSRYNREFDVQLDLPHIDKTIGGILRFQKYENTGAPVTAVFSDTSGDDTICAGCQTDVDYPVPRWGSRYLRIIYTDQSYNNYYWQLRNIRVDYRQPLSARADSALRMTVFSSGDTGVISYRFSSTGSGLIYVFRIPPDESAVGLVDTIPGGTPYVWSDTGNSGARYFLCNGQGFITLADGDFSLPPTVMSGSNYTIPDLRDASNFADYLIVTHPAFLNQANQLADHKAHHGFTSPRIVSINDIYTAFAGGNMDPVALRNFLAFVVRNWQSQNMLDYVVLMGCGNYDYKQVYTSEKNYIPPMELGGNTCVEDFYAALSPGDFSSSGENTVALGRLPCQTQNDINNAAASVMVNKIIATEGLSADWGSWRNTMMLVADDDMQGMTYDGGICSPNNQSGHTVSSEMLAAAVGTARPWLDLRKVYEYNYPWNTVREKPEASAAIVNQINSGVGYVNYFGHGSYVYWADEHVLQPSTVQQLYNANRYPFISSFSCGVSTFDKPGNTSLAECLFNAPGAGAIASFASTRGAMPWANTELGINLYDLLFTAQSPTIGMAILNAKLACGGNSNGNSNVYVLLGDPSVRLANLSRRVVLKLYDADNKPQSDTLMAMQQINIKGTIVDQNGVVDGSFGTTLPAFVQVTIFNPPEITGRKDGGADTTVRWLRPGKPIFSAQTAVRNGSFEQAAIIPPSIIFDQSGARLTAYAWEDSVAGGGCDSIFFHGTCTKCTSSNDTVGPRITLRPVYDIASMRSGSVSFTDHIVSSLPLKCEIDLFDQSGINVIDNGPDQGLTMEIPGIISRRNINYKFQFAEGDFRKGNAVLSFEENSLNPGNYNLQITAQDLLGNVSKAKFVLEITDMNTFALDHVFNTPNPMRMGESTRFFFYPSTTTTQNVMPALDFNVVIKIYSLGGRLLKVIKNASNGEAWDGRDQTGYPLPPNIYLYQVTADYPSQEKIIKSKIQKLVIHPPRK